MILKIKAHLDYKLEPGTTALLQVETAALGDQRIREASLEVNDPMYFARIPAEDGVGERAWLQTGQDLLCDYEARIEVDRPVVDLATLGAAPPHELPGDVVKYLIGSRFIASEAYQGFVEAEFGSLSGGARIARMRDWIEAHLDYEPGTSDGNTTASDTFIMRKGVCRDYAHVMIALARASLIPARMVSVYAPGVEPPDFHAVAEVFLAGAWHLVDATGMARTDSIARIGVGRDAADIAFLTIFGASELRNQEVSVEIE